MGNGIRGLRIACGAIWLAALDAEVTAQAYPSRPIRMVVPLAPGGGTDTTGRIVSQKVAEQMGATIVIENRPGAGTIIGTEVVAKWTADGGAGSARLGAWMRPGSGQYFLSTHPSVPAKSVKDLIALARARPERITYGSSGNGSANHLAGVLLQTMTGTKLVHVPYKGAGPSAIALMSGEIDFMFSSTTAAMGPIKSGRLRAVAVTGPKRLALTPDIPTVSESGVPGFAVTGWYMFLAPAGVRREIIARHNAEVVKAVHSPAVKERFATLGTEPVGNSPEECAEFLRAEIAKWAKVVKASGAKAD